MRRDNYFQKKIAFPNKIWQNIAIKQTITLDMIVF